MSGINNFVNFILDTNVIISYLNGKERVIKQLLNWKENGVYFLISVITEIEVLSFPKLMIEEILKIQRFLEEFTIIPLASQIGKIASEIKRKYNFKLGASVIIAIAKLTNSNLVTLDKSIINKAQSIIIIKTIA